ncbi:hypothetical protein SODG_006295 [Sodalis praecaptivus]
MIECRMQQLDNNVDLDDFIRKNDGFIKKVMDSDILIKPINVRNTVPSLTSFSSESLSNNDILSKITEVRNLTESLSLNKKVEKELIDALCLALIEFKKEESLDFAKYLAFCSAEGKYPWHISTMMEGHGFYSDYYKRNDRNERVINEHSL